ncbi:MAG: Fe-S cluster assembly protein SufD [Candidatus Zixiibacteriota bacterium]
MSATNTIEKVEQTYTIEQLEPELLTGPGWLTEKRQVSRTAFNDAPVPRRGLHLWRYTDPNQFLFDREQMGALEISVNHRKVEEVALKQLREEHTLGLAVDLGGRDIKFHGRDALLKKGVVLGSLKSAISSHLNLVQEYLYRQINNDSGKFESMNGALWQDGVFVYVPDNAVIEKPLHILHDAGVESAMSFPRVLVIIGKNAECTIIDEYSGGGMDREKGITYANGAVEIFGLQDSRTRYVFLQRQASAITSYLTHRAQIEQGANMMTIALSFGGSVTKQNFGVTLNGSGAESNMYGLLFGTERQHFDNHTLHRHNSGQTSSNIDFKVVLRDRALSAYTGLIRIENTAKGCEAYQENRNLLLNPGARAETIPELEILNQDVMCTHGATIGPIDPDMVFYLTSRGLRKPEAVQMIVSGFVSDTLKMVPEDLRLRITDFVEQRLENI